MVEVEPLVRCKLASFNSVLNPPKTRIVGIIPEGSKKPLQVGHNLFPKPNKCTHNLTMVNSMKYLQVVPLAFGVHQHETNSHNLQL